MSASGEGSEPVFLSSEWWDLVMLNYVVERDLLEPLVPPGTVLDTYKGSAYLSVVGFRFLNTRLLGITVPFHRCLEEVNLRFYVRRFNGEEWRKGVVFIRELVPKPAVAFVARAFYNENYSSLPMRHEVSSGAPEGAVLARYEWKVEKRWNRMELKADETLRPLKPASLEEFITENYWGYAWQKDGSVMEYRVQHPPWRYREATSATLDCDLNSLWGQPFAKALNAPPASAFLVDGSEVTVRSGTRFRAGETG